MAKKGKTLEELEAEGLAGGPEAVEGAPEQGGSFRVQSTRRGADPSKDPGWMLEMGEQPGQPEPAALPAPTGALAALLGRLKGGALPVPDVGRVSSREPNLVASDSETPDRPSELERQLRASLELKGIPMGCVECGGLGKPGLRGCSLCYRQRVQDSTLVDAREVFPPEESLQKQFNLPPTRPQPSGGEAVDLEEEPVVTSVYSPKIFDALHSISALDPQFPSGTFSIISGQAGTGKTFLLRGRPHSEELVATTGIAAINLGGATINSLLGYFDTASLKDAYVMGTVQARLRGLYDQGCRRINLDEVSMLGGDALDVLVDIFDDVNETLQQKGRPPLGLTLCGDFAQLPPIKAPFAFEARAWDRFERNRLVLTEIRRQADRAFIEALQAVRRGEAQKALEFFSGRFVGALDPRFKGSTIKSKNDEVDRYNGLMLRELPGDSLLIENQKAGVQRGEWKNIPLELEVKKGALVMVLANRRTEGQPPGCYDYVNGDLATFVQPVGSGLSAKAQVKLLRDESLVVVDRARRATTEGTGKDAKEIGSVDYLPLRLAWATTCHKCCKDDTPMLVRHWGMVPLRYVKIGDEVWAGPDWVKVIGKSPELLKSAYRITTHHGYSVVASEDHRWPVGERLGQQKRTIDINPGDWLISGETGEPREMVTAVENLGRPVPMFDLEVEHPDHLVSFGGIVGSNSQGLSLDQVQVDIRGGFFTSPGMLYVALSRARTAEGLRLVGNEKMFAARCTVNKKVKEWL